MALEGVDYSFGRPGGAALAKAGKRFVVRYVAYDGDGGKGLTKGEVADLRNNGLAIALVWEVSQGRALQGGPVGAADAQTARGSAAAIGFPSSLPIYFAVDFDAQPYQQPAIDAYLRGAATVVGANRVGVYGGLFLISRCRANKSAMWFWQTLAWSAGRVAAFAHIYQYATGSTGAKPINGAAVDYDRALKTNYGQWDPPLQGGPQQGADVPGLAITKIKPVSGTVTVKGPGRVAIRVSDAAFIPIPDGNTRPAIYTGTLAPVPGHPDVKGPVYGIGDDEAVLLVGDGVTFTPAASGATPVVVDVLRDGVKVFEMKVP